jgi:hypothetical protein
MGAVEWLLEGDPAIRWQVCRDLLGSPAREVAAERARVAQDGWGAALLAVQDPDGTWGGGFYSPKWVSTTYTLLLLRHCGIDPADPATQRAIERLVGGGATWRPGSALGSGGHGFFEYLGETCVTAMNLALGCYFGVVGERTTEVVEWLLSEQMGDGGWNCERVRGSTRGSFHTTISAVEGLLEFEKSGWALSLGDAARQARGRAYDYLLDRRLMRSLRSGDIINQSWQRFSFPPRWWYDVLRALDHLRDAAVVVDDRWSEGLALLDSKRTADGRWRLQNHHAGREHFRMEDPGRPSRWNTLRALRVRRYAGAAAG